MKINSLPNDKILDVAQMIISVFDRVENIVGKGENAGLPAFSPFPTMFQKPSL